MRVIPWLVLGGILSQISLAGIVRTLTVDETRMFPIHLSMGKSTVLHFYEKPIKIIVGNQNYFNIQFTGNDVTIQPLGAVTSNLFVYGEQHRYGFILRIGSQSRYDDLVNVRWRATRLHLPFRRNLLPKRPPQLIISVPPYAIVTVSHILKDERRGLHLMDMEISSTSQKVLRFNETTFRLTRKGTALPIKKVVFEKETLQGTDEKTKARLILKLSKETAFTLWAFIGGKKAKVIIPTKSLQ
ncbi:MAG: hypothetical protein IH950_16410 [Bacteroidetes bacterium]|nr:hypothetical protein [Bacteroidota bacterium]